MRQHVTRLSQTCLFHLRRLRSLRRQLGRDVMTRLVSALVLSRLDYCNAVLTRHPASTLAPLQRVLHAAAGVVMDLRPHDHVSPALQDLHWLPIKQRIEFKLCLLVHKTLVGHSPEYKSDLLTSAADRRIRTTCPPNGKPWRFHCATDQSKVRRQSILCCSSSSVE